MARYRKKPVVIEAVQWTGSNASEVNEWLAALDPDDGIEFHGSVAVIATLEGTMSAQPGDWIIRGVKGELYPCKPDIFAATYDPTGS